MVGPGQQVVGKPTSLSTKFVPPSIETKNLSPSPLDPSPETTYTYDPLEGATAIALISAFLSDNPGLGRNQVSPLVVVLYNRYVPKNSVVGVVGSMAITAEGPKPTASLRLIPLLIVCQVLPPSSDR